MSRGAPAKPNECWEFAFGVKAVEGAGGPDHDIVDIDAGLIQQVARSKGQVLKRPPSCCPASAGRHIGTIEIDRYRVRIGLVDEADRVPGSVGQGIECDAAGFRDC